MKEANQAASACIINNQFIYVIGGLEIQYLNGINKYAIQNNQWETIHICSGQ